MHTIISWENLFLTIFLFFIFGGLVCSFKIHRDFQERKKKFIEIRDKILSGYYKKSDVKALWSEIQFFSPHDKLVLLAMWEAELLKILDGSIMPSLETIPIDEIQNQSCVSGTTTEEQAYQNAKNTALDLINRIKNLLDENKKTNRDVSDAIVTINSNLSSCAKLLKTVINYDV